MSEQVKLGKQKRLQWLYEEHDAANQQRSMELSGVNQLKLKRQIDSLETQIVELEQELGISTSQHTKDIKLLLRHTAQTLRLQSRHFIPRQ